MTPSVRYPVRTPLWVYAVLVAVVALSGWLSWTIRGSSWSVLPLVLPLVGLYGARPYLVRSGTVDLWPDRLELPSWWGPPLALPLAHLTIERVRVVQDVRAFHVVPLGDVDRGVYVTFRAGGRRRVLSDRVFTDPDQVGGLIGDVELARGGHAPQGPEGWQRGFATAEELLARAKGPPPSDRFLQAMEQAAPADED